MQFTPDDANEEYIHRNYKTMYGGIKAICDETRGKPIEIPDNENVVECRVLFPASETPVLQICHKQEYPHNTHNCSSIADIAETILQINSMFIETMSVTKVVNSATPESVKKEEKRCPSPSKIKRTDKSKPLKKSEISKSKTATPKKIPLQIQKNTADNSSFSISEQVLPVGGKYYVNGKEAKVNLYEGTAVTEDCIMDWETSEVNPVMFKGMKNLHNSYISHEHKVLCNLSAGKTVFVTISYDGDITYANIDIVAKKVRSWLKRNYTEAKGVIVLEPDWTGRWHIHILANNDKWCHEKQIQKFESATRNFAKKNGQENVQRPREKYQNSKCANVKKQ